MASPRAVLDANVLVPVSLTDTLLRSAEHGRFLPLWTEKILDEVVRNVARLHPEHDIARIHRRIEAMKHSFPEAMVAGWEELEADMTNDSKDRHVLAAAVRSKADLVVTSNVRDFPASACEPHNVVVARPDDFLVAMWADDVPAASNLINEQAADLRAHDRDSLLDLVARHAPRFAALVRSAADE